MPVVSRSRRSLPLVVAAGALLSCAGDRPETPIATPTPTATPAIADAALPTVEIKDWPIAWTDERAALMLEYRRAHSDPAATDLAISPQVIVLHYTSGDSAKGTKGYFDHTFLEAKRARLREGGAVNVSAHFLVDRDGTIYRLQPETRMARHCIGLNHVAIGVENVGDDKTGPRLTAAQIDANAALIRWLVAKYRITTLIGHHEAAVLEGTPLFVELDPTYHNDKPDPGARFMTAVRARLSDLDLGP